MIGKVERKQSFIYLWDSIGTAPTILTKDEAVDLAKMLLDTAGHIVEEDDTEEAI